MQGIGIVGKAREWVVQQTGKITRAVQSSDGKSGQRLSTEQQSVIDEWLARNKLNEYGDPLDTLYAGGTPLFDEATGKSLNRFDYLFAKFPELKDVVTQGLKERLGDVIEGAHAQTNN